MDKQVALEHLESLNRLIHSVGFKKKITWTTEHKRKSNPSFTREQRGHKESGI